MHKRGSPMDQPLWIRTCRVAFAVLAFAALVGKYIHDTDGPAQYLSEFTTQSNAIGMVVLFAGAFLGSRTASSIGWTRVRGAAVMYLLTTAIVYGVLLEGFDNPFTSGRDWTHTVLHQVMPVVMVLDLIARPLRHRLTWRDAVTWTAYPILYLIYSLVREAVVDWYPYDFINPGEVGGYDGVALYAAGITAGFLAVAMLIVRVSRLAYGLPLPHAALPAPGSPVHR